jgi:hypothetical protein
VRSGKLSRCSSIRLRKRQPWRILPTDIVLSWVYQKKERNNPFFEGPMFRLIASTIFVAVDEPSEGGSGEARSWADSSGERLRRRGRRGRPVPYAGALRPLSQTSRRML